MKDQATKQLYFPKDVFYNDTENPLYTKGVHAVPLDMVERWMKRGASLDIDPDLSEKASMAQLDAQLAKDLETEGVGTHDETMEAFEDAGEFEEAEEKTSAKKTPKKKGR